MWSLVYHPKTEPEPLPKTRPVYAVGAHFELGFLFGPNLRDRVTPESAQGWTASNRNRNEPRPSSRKILSFIGDT